jgi:transcriptional regulator of acetoin/glycerol metabolism
VRELRNVIERLLLFPDSPRSAFGEDRGLIDHRRLPTDLGNITYADFKRSILDPLEKTYLTAILDSCRGVVSKAARRARLPRQSFYRLVERHDLKQKS